MQSTEQSKKMADLLLPNPFTPALIVVDMQEDFCPPVLRPIPPPTDPDGADPRELASRQAP